MPVQDMFLIIANYKTFKNWNLIPLKNLTMVLGPNSAGKSIIYEVIEILRDLRIGYEEYKGPVYENTVFGFSCPYEVYPQFYDWFDLSHDGIEQTGKGDKFNPYNAPEFFILDELTKEKGIFEGTLIKKRYTLVSSDHCLGDWLGMCHEVYMDDKLLAKLEQVSDEDPSLLTSDKIKFRYTFTKEANVNIFLPSYFDRLFAVSNDNYGLLERFDEKIIQNATNKSEEKIFAEILSKDSFVEYYPANLYEGFESYPKCIVGQFSSTDYFDDYVGFSMAMALYHYPIRTFLGNNLYGCVSQDTRDLCSDWKDTTFKKIDTRVYVPDIYSMINDALEQLNKWLSAKWIFDAPYSIEKEEIIELPRDVLDSEFRLNIEKMVTHLHC